MPEKFFMSPLLASSAMGPISYQYRFLMVDGTKVRLQGPKGIDLCRVDMRWALASVEENKPFESVGF